MPAFFLCLLVVCCGWSGNVSVYQQHPFMRRNIYLHDVADKKKNESADCLQH